MAVEVRSETISGQDVTSEYTDLQSHLRNLEAAETKLQQSWTAPSRPKTSWRSSTSSLASATQIEQVEGPDAVLRAVGGHVGHQRRPDPRRAQPARLTSVAGSRRAWPRTPSKPWCAAFQGLATGPSGWGIYILPLALVIGLPVYVVLRLVARRLRRTKPVTA